MSANRDTRAPVEAITFDVGGTLIECWPSVGHVYAEVAARHGHLQLSPELLNRRFKEAWKRLKHFHHTFNDWATLVDATFGELVQPPPSFTFFPELYDRFSDPNAWRVFEDVLPVLKKFKSQGIALGIISNWDERLRPLLGRLKLDHYFDAIVVSCEAGSHKPSPAIFATACAALRSRTANTLHVGDSFEMDVAGARAAGLQTRWLRREGPRASRDAITSLRALDKL
jgi:putative hydrolase of the HAD superfamily